MQNFKNFCRLICIIGVLLSGTWLWWAVFNLHGLEGLWGRELLWPAVWWTFGVLLLFLMGVALERVKPRIRAYIIAAVCWTIVATGLLAIAISGGIFTQSTFGGFLQFQWQSEKILFIYISTLFATISGMLITKTGLEKIIKYLNHDVFS